MTGAAGGAAAPGQGRWPVLDAAKGVACLFIVLHHLALYGPLAEAAQPLAPGVLAWLASHGRLAVQVFLVIGGYLAAASLAPQGQWRQGPVLRRVRQRYLRLVAPYLVALTLSVLVSGWTRPWLPADGLVPEAPTWGQLAAHMLLLHDLLGFPALSAGVWYVAIDFQLFLLAALLCALAVRIRHRWPGRPVGRWAAVLLVLAMAVASLVTFNRASGLDTTALYFFGAYGLGMLAWWIGQARRESTWQLAMAALLATGGAALWFDWRSRIALALATAVALCLARHRWQGAGTAWPAWTQAPQWLGSVSYSLFLLHFPVLLAVSALAVALGPLTPLRGAAGLVSTLALSLVGAAMLHRMVEGRPATWRTVARDGLLLVGSAAWVTWG